MKHQQSAWGYWFFCRVQSIEYQYRTVHKIEFAENLPVSFNTYLVHIRSGILDKYLCDRVTMIMNTSGGEYRIEKDTSDV